MSNLKPINGYDPNYFLENQLHNINNTWDLFGPKLTEGKNKQFSIEIDHDKPILSGIIQENSLVISGAHDYSGAGSGKISGMVGDLVGKAKDTFNSLSDAMATDVGFIRDAAGERTADNIENQVSRLVRTAQESLTSSLGRGSVMSQLINAASQGVNNVMKLPGAQMITAFDYVKVFKGTSLSYNIPALETRLIHGVHHARHLASGKYSSERYDDVREKLVHLNNYFIGAMASITGYTDNETSMSLDDIIGFQAPPAGYKPKFSLIKQYEELPNTFTLRYGNFMIPNLLIGSFNYNISNIKVRKGKSARNNANYSNNSTFHDMYTEVVKSPLYADVSISLIPCTYISRGLINSIITGQYSGNSDGIFKDLIEWGFMAVGKGIEFAGIAAETITYEFNQEVENYDKEIIEKMKPAGETGATEVKSNEVTDPPAENKEG